MTRREVLRRSVHVALGAGAFLLPWLGWRPVAGLCLLAILFNSWLLPRLPGVSLLHRADRSGHAGLVLYPAVLLVALLIFREDHQPVQAGWIALAVGDGLAPFFGLILKRPRWPHLPTKTVSASFAACSFAAAVTALVAPLPLALAAGAGAFLGEAASGVLDDNVTVPAGAVLGFVLVRGLSGA